VIEYALVPAETRHVEELARTIADADRAEVWAAMHMPAHEAIALSVAGSREPMAGLADGRVVCMFGVAQVTLLSAVGIPWLLGSRDLPQHRVRFLRESHRYIRRIALQFDLLVNYCRALHVRAVRWIEWLGFQMHPAEPFGPDRALFHRFDMRTR